MKLLIGSSQLHIPCFQSHGDQGLTTQLLMALASVSWDNSFHALIVNWLAEAVYPVVVFSLSEMSSEHVKHLL